MTGILRGLADRHWLIFTAYATITGVAAAVTEVAGARLSEGFALVFRLMSGVPTHQFLYIIGLLLVVLHLPVHVAHGVTRRDYAVACAVFAGAASTVFALFTSGIQLLDGPVGAAEVLRSGVSHLGFNLVYLGTGWLTGLTYYRLNPWLATLLLPLVLVPVLVAEWAYGDIWSGMPYMLAAGPGRSIAFPLALAVLAATVAAAMAAGYALVRRLPLRPKRA